MDTKVKSGKLLFSINEVFADNGYLKEKNKTHFNIPHYQRGYKWEPNNVEKLLTDISNFQSGDGKFYCLQNITIVSYDEYFNVVDGQQRLTTLTLILSFLDNKKLVTGKVRFPDNSIRKYTNRFLNEVVTNEDATFPVKDWEGYIEEYPEYDLQDIGYIFRVYKAIEAWFEQREKLANFDKQIFKTKLLNDVRMIVNEVDGMTSEEKVFGNLNSKRIPLDGSDLIRAILITRVAKEEGRKENDLKNVVYVNERRVKIGWELDQINNWWGKEEVRGFFSNFISIKSELVGGDKKLFNEELYPVNILYLLYAESKGERKLTLDLIEQHTNDPKSLYKEILKLHNTFQDWYEDREVYHFLGFLFNVRSGKLTFNKVWQIWLDSDTRDEFLEKLKQQIRGYFNDEDDALIDFKDVAINWYHNNPESLVMALILMDIIHSIRPNSARLPYNKFWKQSDDVEHIFPQNPKEIKNKKAYVEFLNKYVTPEQPFNLDGFDPANQDFLDVLNSHIEEVTSKIPIHSIGNLVLLYRKLNQSISNSIYSAKRSRIIEFYSAGNFIQPHTFRVFTRDFNDSGNVNRDYEYWTNDDIKRSCEYINDEINSFFKNEKP